MTASASTNQPQKRKSKKVSQNDRCIGFNVSMPISEFLILDNQAQTEGVSRSELVRKAIQYYYQQTTTNNK